MVKPLLISQPITSDGRLPSREIVEVIQGIIRGLGGSGGGLADGIYGDVTVSGGGTVITINTGAVSSGEIAGLSEAIDDRVAALLVAGSGVTITYNDPGNTLTISQLSGTATVTVPNNAWEWSQTVAAAGVSVSNTIVAALGAHVDADENSAELLDIAGLSGTAGTGQITFDIAFAAPTAGAVKIAWMAA